MEQIFLITVQFVSDNRFWILPGFLGLMVMAVIIDGWMTVRRGDRLI